MEILKVGKNKLFPMKLKCDVCHSLLSINDTDLSIGCYDNYYYTFCPLCSSGIYIDDCKKVTEIKAYKRAKSLTKEIENESY